MRAFSVARHGAITAAALALGLSSVAACSSSGSGGDSKEIVIGAIGSYSGRTASNIGPAKQGIVAWAASVNARGGIAGKHVKLIVEDDGGNATTALDDVKKLVDQDHVVAIVSDNSVVDTTWASYVAGKGVPVVGGLSILPTFETNADFYPSGASSGAQTYGELLQAKTFGSRAAAFFCAEDPACAQVGRDLKTFAKSAGVTMSVLQAVSSSAPSYVPQCQAIKDAHANSMMLILPGPTLKQIADQCQTLGIHVGLVSGGGTITPDLLSVRSLAGLKNVDNHDPLFVKPVADKSSAGKDFEAFTTKYASQFHGQFPPFFVNSWIQGRLFEAAVKAANTSNLTSAAIKKGLYALPDGFTLGGLTPPLHYKSGQATVVNCAFVDVIQNNAWASAASPTVCAPPNVLSQGKG